MSKAPALIPLFAAAALLAACGQKTASASDQASAPTEPASAPAIATPAQAKALVASLPAPFNAGDPEAGKAKFTPCASCHTVTQGGPNMTGPNLYGVFGRKRASLASFDYSDALKALGGIWDATTINTWIANPQAVAPGTRMSYPGLKDPKDRADVIAYLKVATSPVP
jgi:cytochrome c